MVHTTGTGNDISVSLHLSGVVRFDDPAGVESKADFHFGVIDRQKSFDFLPHWH